MKNVRAKKPTQTAFEAYSSVIEAFLEQVGIDPKEARLESRENGRGGWQFQRGSASIFIYLEDAGDRQALRIVSPILYLPPANLLPFYRRCLEINDGLRDCALAVQDDVILLVSDRPLDGLTPEEIVQNIDILSMAADNLDDQLAKEFSAKLYSESAP
jgi:hypothetical protein